MEATGDALGGAKFTVAGTTLPAAGAMDVLLRHDPWGAAVAATPYALKYGGKGMQAVGGAIEAAPEAMRSLIGTDEASTNASLKDAAAKRGASLRRDYGIRQATSKPYRAGSGASDPYVAAEPRAPVTTPPPGDYTTRGAGIEGGRMTMPSPDEPIYSDVRSQLDDVAGLDDELALTREMIAKGFKPSTARRIVSPAMKSLEESAPTSGRYSELLSRFGGKQSVQEPSGDMPGAWQSFMMTPQEEAARNAKTIAESAARRKR